MNYKLTALFTVLTLFLAACGVQERIENEVSEQIVEQVASQLSDADVDLDFDADGDFASISIDDGQGGTIDFSTEANADTDVFSAFDFNIALPNGILEGAKQVTQQNGQDASVTASYTLENNIDQPFFDELEQAVLAEGFTKGVSFNSDDSVVNGMFNYEHASGYMLSILAGEQDVIVTMTKTEPSTGSSTSESMEIPTVLDGSMSLDKETYTVEEMIVVSLQINTPLASDAWVGIVPSDTPHGLESDADAVDLAYAYVESNEEITLYAPYEPGQYDVRLFNTDSSDGVELASVTITVNP